MAISSAADRITTGQLRECSCKLFDTLGVMSDSRIGCAAGGPSAVLTDFTSSSLLLPRLKTIQYAPPRWPLRRTYAGCGV